MKTKLLSMMILVFATSQITANPIHGTEPVVTKKTDSSEVVEIKLDMKLDQTTETLTVDLTGKFEEYTSISVTDNRGSEFFFQFVEDGSHQHVFNVSSLEKGSYFLILNTNDEIRMKRFQIN